MHDYEVTIQGHGSGFYPVTFTVQAARSKAEAFARASERYAKLRNLASSITLLSGGITQLTGQREIGSTLPSSSKTVMRRGRKVSV